MEDTKGNNGDQGDLHATNLRLLWVSKKNKKTNISIGFNCITAINVKEANSRLKGADSGMHSLILINAPLNVLRIPACRV